MVRVKICGITNLADAKVAVEAGADALGFVFAKSPRRVTPDRARAIVSALGPWVATVGVFVNEAPDRVRRIAERCGLTAVQLHGSETPASLKKFAPLRTIKTFHVDDTFSASVSRPYEAASGFLLDTRVGNRLGGTGMRFDWAAASDRVRGMRRPVIISGGLTPDNVREAVRVFSPYGVDVSSGVERSPGKKDPQLVKEFIRNARS